MLGHLAQGIPGKVEYTNNIFFINKSKIPINYWNDITYGRVVVDYCPEKLDPYLTRKPLEAIESTTMVTAVYPLSISSQ